MASRPVNEIFRDDPDGSKKNPGGESSAFWDKVTENASRGYSRKVATPDEGGQALVQDIEETRRQIKRSLA
jgi:hypothetical protein